MRLLQKRRVWLRWWGGKFRSLLFDIAVAALVAGSIRNTLAPATVPVVVLAAATVLAFVVRRRFPWAPLIGSVALYVLGTESFAPLVALYTMVRWRGPGTQSWIAVGVVAIGQYIGAYPIGTPYLLAIPLLAVGVAALLGLWVYQRKQLLVTLRERAEQAERERDLLAERAVTAERRRIAREMHDVVAHRVSVISVQAGGLTVAAPDERTGELAETIRSTSVTALNELRSMLRVLRDDTSETTERSSAELGTDPTVGSIAPLVRENVETGANIHLDMPEALPGTSGEVGRAAYRVVQEALTNAAKHAPHAEVHVEITTADEQLVVTVFNRGRGNSGTGTDTVPGSGYGLLGMRERVTLAGGTLHTGPTEDGGYRVRAVFPLHTDEVAAA
ncbi:signal transduction histidine kinase [Actinopolyspora biskrensis]|uniref:histidine kinase n=1 Tax=Actinopolyspora biskrensis TaxID=1470178 RepID=A0A852YTS3_9ACTN|nr:signal transduction histidine kinase [Actinopolyspora biskrensis]